MMGGGGHARVLLELLAAAGIPAPMAILDSDPQMSGDVQGIPVLGDDALLGEVEAETFVLGVGKVDVSPLRQNLFEKAKGHGLRPLTLVHPEALVSPSAVLGSGSQVLMGAVIGTGSQLGENVLVNTGAIVDHDCRIGAHTHVATGARLAGGVHVGEGTLVGLGAVVREGRQIGKGVLIAAGAVVVEDIPDHSRFAGVPARPM